MKIKNKELIQSYIFTTAKYDFDVYEKRILIRIVERLQDLVNGKELKFKYPIQESLFGEKTFVFDVADFLNGEDDKNHTRIKHALSSLRNKAFEYDDGKVWEYLGIIESPSVKYYDKTVSFKITPRVYEAFLNFSKGYKKFELELSMKFESVYAMRFYELLSNQKTPLTYSIIQLKEMFGLTEKYNGKDGASNFIKRVIEPAKTELDKHSPVSFNFKYKDREFKREGKLYHILFIPYDIPKNKNIEIEKKQTDKQVSLVWDIHSSIIDALKRDYEFSTEELKHHRYLLKQVVNLAHFPDFYSKTRAEINTSIKRGTARNPKGIFIGKLKEEVEKELKKQQNEVP